MANLLAGVINTFEGVVDGVGQVAQIVIGSAARTVEHAVGTAVEAGIVVSTVPFTFIIDRIGHESAIFRTATGIFKEADDEPRKGLINEVLIRAQGLIDLETFLEAAHCSRLWSIRYASGGTGSWRCCHVGTGFADSATNKLIKYRLLYLIVW